MININGKEYSIFCDNKDLLNNKKYSLLIPLVKIDEQYILFIRLTTKKPYQNEKIYIEIEEKWLSEISYIRFDRQKCSDFHTINIEKIKKYKCGYIPNFKQKYKKIILENALKSKYLSPIHLDLINKELKIVTN